jgi:uncharacterized membrane protein
MEFNTKVYTNNPKHALQIFIRFVVFALVGFGYSKYMENYEPLETIWEKVVNYVFIALIFIVWLWFGSLIVKIKKENKENIETKTIPIKKKSLLIIIGIIFGVVIVSFGILFFNGENVAVGTSKSVAADGDVKVKIYSLKGHHHIESFEFENTEEDILEIPYYASVEKGEITLFVQNSEEVIWEENIKKSKTGKIELEVKKGDYDIYLYTEKAKKINLNIELY